MDILGFDLSNAQHESLAEVHRLCAMRMAIRLPENINSPRGETYEKVHELDARIENLSPLLEFSRTELVNKVDEETGKLVVVEHTTPVSPNAHTRLVWQYYFIDHPISMN